MTGLEQQVTQFDATISQYDFLGVLNVQKLFMLCLKVDQTVCAGVDVPAAFFAAKVQNA
jgi:hypothetical protein